MDKTAKVAIVLVVVGLIIFAAGTYFQLFATEVNTVIVENLFVDVDNDGDLDLLVSGEVVINDPPLTRNDPNELP